MKYKLKAKQKRNEKLYRFWVEHPDWTLKSIGAVYHISATRVCVIINNMKRQMTPITPK